MAGSIEDNTAIYKKKTFTYVPPAAPAVLLDSTSYTLDFTARKFILVGLDPTDNFQTVIHLLTSSRHVKLSTEFLKRIFSLMGNVLSFILDLPQSYKRTIFLETDFYKLSSMVYGGVNVLVIESKTEDGCRVLLNRTDLIQLQKLEWCISASIDEKDIFIKPKIIDQMNQYCDYLAEKILQADSLPKNVHEMQIFINNIEVGQTNQNQYLSQIKLFASTQLAELCMTQLKSQNSHENEEIDSPISPSYSSIPDTQDPNNTFNQPDILAKAFDQIDGPDGIPQSVDVNDGPDYFNRFYSPSSTYMENPVPSPTYNKHPVPTQKRSQSTFAEHPTPVRKVKRRLF